MGDGICTVNDCPGESAGAGLVPEALHPLVRDQIS
jgi:hypothetical protein